MPNVIAIVPLNADNFDSGAASNGQVLTADGAGNSAWQDASGGGGAIDITYADLVTAIGASTLTVGGFYRITDFATKHYIVDANKVQYTTGDGIITGAVEPLVVQAIATNAIGSQAFSALYPQDIIYYDWNPAHWLTDLSFAKAGAIVSGFTGVITFRRDTIYDNYAPGDWRNCKTRRWKTNATAWSSSSSYVAGNIVSHDDGYVYKALQPSLNQEPVGGDNEYWVIMLNLNTYEYWNAASTNWRSITSGAEYADFTLFGSGQARSVHFEPMLDNAVYNKYFRTILPNNALLDAATCYGCSIGSGSFFNTIDGYFINNTIGASFYGNLIAVYYDNNTVGALFYNNVVGDAFEKNTVGAGFYNNTIGGYFSSNTVDTDFASNIIGINFANNAINSGFFTNKVSTDFSYNTIGASFQRNVLGQYFRNNNVGNSVLVNIDLADASHVYADYNCNVYHDKTLGDRLSYMDNDTVVYVAVTA